MDLANVFYLVIGAIILTRLLDIYLFTRLLVPYSRWFVPYMIINRDAPRFGLQSNHAEKVFVVPMRNQADHMVIKPSLRDFFQLAVRVPTQPARRHLLCISPCSLLLYFILLASPYLLFGVPDFSEIWTNTMDSIRYIVTPVALTGWILVQGFFALQIVKKYAHKAAPAGIY